MLLPDEIVATRVLPTIRAMLARELKAQGLTEREIAERLLLTQSAISKYLRGRVKLEPLIESSVLFRGLVADLARGLVSGTTSSFEALAHMMQAIRREEDRGLVCELHERAMPQLVDMACDLCVRLGYSMRLQEEEALNDLRVALRQLETIDGFASLIPNVGSNVARAKSRAQSTLDVAAVPGRIFEMRGVARVPAPPEFGASKHVAEVVLAVQRAHPEVRAAMNVRWNDRIMDSIRRIGWVALEFDAEYEGRSKRIAEIVSSSNRRPEVLFHRGAFGIEPITYLLGGTAIQVVEMARELTETYVHGLR